MSERRKRHVRAGASFTVTRRVIDKECDRRYELAERSAVQLQPWMHDPRLLPKRPPGMR